MLALFQLYWLLHDNSMMKKEWDVLNRHQTLDKLDFLKLSGPVDVYQLFGLVRNDRQGVESNDPRYYSTKLLLFPVYREFLHFFVMLIFARYGNQSIAEVHGAGAEEAEGPEDIVLDASDQGERLERLESVGPPGDARNAEGAESQQDDMELQGN